MRVWVLLEIWEGSVSVQGVFDSSSKAEKGLRERTSELFEEFEKEEPLSLEEKRDYLDSQDVHLEIHQSYL